MAENYKHLYEQMKKMVAMYQDELIPGFRKQVEEIGKKANDIAERNERLRELFDEAVSQIPKWIPVTERLPDDNERVIAYRPNEPETSAYKYCVMWGWSVKTSLKHRGITHWYAMPQPPKGE